RGVEYAYQYLIDGNLRVADYLTEKILDPEDDPFIPASTYPNLKPYPTGRTTGNVSIFQTAKPGYTWRINNFTRPDKRNLVMYELLVRDFVAAQNYTALRDTLSYLKRLGINSIHLMPINEFEGNNSWGYNPSFMLAPDKYYGTENALKQFIDECHAQGIAVVIDMVLNHQFGESPMVRMYWDAATNRPAANSPWFNPVAKHAFNVGFDMNHETQATRDFVDRVVEHWLVNYKIDGFRWDLSKGFTQVQTCDDNGDNCNVGTWSNYDASRIAIWNRIYDKMQALSADSYCILEHLGVNTEERELATKGMLLWGNMNYNFNEATMGNLGNSNFEGALASKRNWPVNHLMSYQESHDEERLMYRNRTFGVSTNPNHDVKNINVGLARNQVAAAFWAMMPGPKLLWQFGELGYDFSINTCENTSIINNNCRTSPKPVRWDYYNVPERRALYNVYSKLLNLRTNPRFNSTFSTGVLGANNFTGAIKSMTITSDSLNLVVVGNFDVNRQQTTISFPSTGTWYSFLDGSARTVINAGSTNITLEPGQYYVYTNINLATSGGGGGTIAPGNQAGGVQINIAPNPARGANATIRVDVANASGTMAIDLLDIAGRKLHTFYNGAAQATYNTQLSNTGFSGLRLQAGVYLIRTVYGGQTTIKKFVITP
ncbi:MAG: T9SS C-terminal target domain-containing protein, partial [Bacteroidetes bacterium]